MAVSLISREKFGGGRPEEDKDPTITAGHRGNFGSTRSDLGQPSKNSGPGSTRIKLDPEDHRAKGGSSIIDQSGKATEERPADGRLTKVRPRLLELSRPRYIRQETARPPGYIAPGALTAIATERTIELSRPRRVYRLKSPRKRNRSFRKEDETRTRRIVETRSSRKTPEREQRLVASAGKKAPRKKKRGGGRARSSNSDRTIITIGLDRGEESAVAKKFHGFRPFRL